MSTKSKGTNAERELIHAFWEKGYAAMRSAGSGSMRHPSPDIIAAKNGKILVIECKITKDHYKYFEKQEIEELKRFAEFFEAEAYVAVKFKGNNWYFLKTNDLIEKDMSFMVDVNLAKERGISFDVLVE